MKKLLPILLMLVFAAAGCKYFSKGTADLAKTNARLDSTLKAEKSAHEKELDQLKQESQMKIDSLKLSCEKLNNRYHIIVGAFKVPGNADSYLKAMNGKGYHAQIVSLGSYQMVSVNACSSLREALGQLGNFRNEVNKDAWIYVR